MKLQWILPKMLSTERTFLELISVEVRNILEICLLPEISGGTYDKFFTTATNPVHMKINEMAQNEKYG